MGLRVRIHGIEGRMTMDTPRTNVEFYFDFMSPFAYLASHRLRQCRQEYGCDIAYNPIDLTRAKKAAGNTGPANREIPVKLRYLIEDLKRWAALYGIPMGFIGNLNSAPLNKGTFYAAAKGQAEDYVERAYTLTWGLSGAPDDVGLLHNLAEGLGWDAEEFLAYIGGDEAEHTYDMSNEDAIALGVFGVPTMIADGQMWWGNDRIFMLETYLETQRTPEKVRA